MFEAYASRRRDPKQPMRLKPHGPWKRPKPQSVRREAFGRCNPQFLFFFWYCFMFYFPFCFLLFVYSVFCFLFFVVLVLTNFYVFRLITSNFMNLWRLKFGMELCLAILLVFINFVWYRIMFSTLHAFIIFLHIYSVYIQYYTHKYIKYIQASRVTPRLAEGNRLESRLKFLKP